MIVHMCRSIVLTVIVTLIQTNEATNSTNNIIEPELNLPSIKTKLTFAKMLKSIVNVNEDRFSAMKRLTQLQDVNVARGVLRTADNRLLKNKPNRIATIVIVKHDKSSEESSDENSHEVPATDGVVPYVNDDIIEDPIFSEDENGGTEKSVILEDDEELDDEGCSLISLRLCSYICKVAFRRGCHKYPCKRCDTICRSLCRRIQ